tara:strand:+ start:89 stop:577 length:489 start_codon:yes stop_codon:yes gene_type:complete
MKKILTPILLLCSFILSAQETLTKNIIAFNTIEKNEKTILFSKQTISNSINYVLSAENKTSKDFNKCKWVSLLTKKELESFAITLAKIKQGETIETNFVTLKAKNNRVRVYFNNTKCTSEHKTHYFQKSCNRKLSFIVQQNQIKEINKTLTKDVEQDFLVNQ